VRFTFAGGGGRPGIVGGVGRLVGEIVSCLLLAVEGEEGDVHPVGNDEALAVVVHFDFEVISPPEGAHA